MNMGLVSKNSLGVQAWFMEANFYGSALIGTDRTIKGNEILHP